MDSKDNIEEKTLIQKIEKAQKELPNITLPNMGIVNNEKKVEINGKDYIKRKTIREE